MAACSVLRAGRQRAPRAPLRAQAPARPSASASARARRFARAPVRAPAARRIFFSVPFRGCARIRAPARAPCMCARTQREPLAPNSRAVFPPPFFFSARCAPRSRCLACPGRPSRKAASAMAFLSSSTSSPATAIAVTASEGSIMAAAATSAREKGGGVGWGKAGRARARRGCCGARPAPRAAHLFARSRSPFPRGAPPPARLRPAVAEHIKIKGDTRIRKPVFISLIT